MTFSFLDEEYSGKLSFFPKPHAFFRCGVGLLNLRKLQRSPPPSQSRTIAINQSGSPRDRN